MYIFIPHVKILYKMKRTQITLNSQNNAFCCRNIFRLLTKKTLMKLYKPKAYNQVLRYLFFNRHPRNPLAKHLCLLQYINTHAQSTTLTRRANAP